MAEDERPKLDTEQTRKWRFLMAHMLQELNGAGFPDAHITSDDQTGRATIDVNLAKTLADAREAEGAEQPATQGDEDGEPVSPQG